MDDPRRILLLPNLPLTWRELLGFRVSIEELLEHQRKLLGLPPEDPQPPTDTT